MGAIVGFVLGYVLGTRSGADGGRELRDAWNTITSSEELKDILSGGFSVMGDLTRQGRALLADRLQRPDGSEPQMSRVA